MTRKPPGPLTWEGSPTPAEKPISSSVKKVPLTGAECAIAIALMRGATCTAIASERGTADRTVANQAQAIDRKLGVGSRLEMCAALGTA